MWSYLQMGIAGSCAAFLPTYDGYCAFRFLCGVASSAISVNSISLSKYLLMIDQGAVINCNMYEPIQMSMD